MVEPRKLTKTEAAWVSRLQAVLMECPKTLELSTMGDRNMSVLCVKRMREVLEEYAAARKNDDGFISDGNDGHNGIRVGYVQAACRIHGVAG